MYNGHIGYGGYVELHAKSFHSFGLGHPTRTNCWRRRWSTDTGAWP